MILEKFKEAVANDDMRGFVDYIDKIKFELSMNRKKIYDFAKKEGHLQKFIEFLKIYIEKYDDDYFLRTLSDCISARDIREISFELSKIPDIFYYSKKAAKSSKSPAAPLNLRNAVEGGNAWQSSISPQISNKKKIILTHSFLRELSSSRADDVHLNNIRKILRLIKEGFEVFYIDKEQNLKDLKEYEQDILQEPHSALSKIRKNCYNLESQGDILEYRANIYKILAQNGLERDSILLFDRGNSQLFARLFYPSRSNYVGTGITNNSLFQQFYDPIDPQSNILYSIANHLEVDFSKLPKRNLRELLRFAALSDNVQFVRKFLQNFGYQKEYNYICAVCFAKNGHIEDLKRILPEIK